MTTVAVMQPYFIPYPGYFRLFAVADVVALFDCVQFPRRGWVHRNRLENGAGKPVWLTLPLAKAPVQTPIADIRLAPDAGRRIGERLAPFLARRSVPAAAERLIAALQRPRARLVDYLEESLGLVCRELGLPFCTVRTSTLGLAPALKGEARVIAAARALGAKRYFNPPGGRSLYRADAFAEAGMGLAFLAPWRGRYLSILQHLIDDDPMALARDIRAQAQPG